MSCMITFLDATLSSGEAASLGQNSLVNTVFSCLLNKIAIIDLL